MKKKFLVISVAIIIVASLASTSLMAQNSSPYWSLAGNSNATSSSKLGTSNNVPLKFFTNNTQRMILDSLGRVGIGITKPVNIFTVKSGGGTPASSWLNGLNTPVFVGFGETVSSEFLLAGASNTAINRAVFQGRRSRGTLASPTVVANNDYITSLLASAYDGSTFQNPALVSFFVDGTPSAGNVPTRISFVTGSNATNRTERLKVGSTGNFDFNSGQVYLQQSSGYVGIGTTTPENMLHIFKGSAGSVTAFSAPLVVENSANCYINMLSPEASATGILFGKPSNNISGGIVYNDVSFNPNGFDFRTNGNISRMILDNAGNLGVGTTAPENYKLKISYNDDNIDASGQKGLDIENTSGNFGDRQDWEIYTAPINNFSDGGLVFFLNSSYRASVNAQTGSWASISDEHLKTNISPMSTMLEKIKQLKPSTYQFKNTKDSTEYNGFIAQDVMKIFPDLVMHNVDPGRKLEVYAMNYSGFGVLAIKGIQELEPIIEEQKKINEEQKTEIVALKERLSKLETALAEVLSRKDIKASINNVTLEQNIPNPLDRSTTIRYSIPANSKNAILVVTDITGKVIKQIQLGSASNGNVSIDATGLSGGSYSYSIIVDGKLMQTKTMIVAKAKVG